MNIGVDVSIVHDVLAFLIHKLARMHEPGTRRHGSLLYVLMISPHLSLLMRLGDQGSEAVAIFLSEVHGSLFIHES